MAYSTLTQLKNYIPESIIQQCSDDSDIDSIDEEKINDVIRRADDYIDGHLRGRYPLPLTSVPSLIQDISTKLATYFLIKRSLLITLPEPVKEDYEYCTDTLTKIQKGKISPFGASEEPVFFSSNKTPNDRLFVTNVTAQGQMDWGKYPF